MTKNSETHIDWKEEIAYIIRHDITHVQASNSKYKNQLTAVVLIKYFTQLLADARREVIIDRIDRLKLYEVIENIYLSGMYTHDKGILRQYMSDIINVLATLKEETL